MKLEMLQIISIRYTLSINIFYVVDAAFGGLIILHQYYLQLLFLLIIIETK